MNQLNFTSQKKCSVCGKPVQNSEMPSCSGQCHHKDRKNSTVTTSTQREVETLLKQYRQTGWVPVDGWSKKEHPDKTEWIIPAKKGKRNG